MITVYFENGPEYGKRKALSDTYLHQDFCVAVFKAFTSPLTGSTFTLPTENRVYYRLIRRQLKDGTRVMSLINHKSSKRKKKKVKTIRRIKVKVDPGQEWDRLLDSIFDDN